jgi:tetratricopeptide (TPR) repeat protein
MKNLKLLVLMIGGLFMTQHTFAQKGKITSAQLNLQDGRVMEAKKDIDAALMDAEIQKRVDAWTTKGDVYKQIYETKLYYTQNPNCLFDSKDAYMKAYELELNPKKQKNFSTPLNMLSGYLFNEGLNRFNNKKYDDSYLHFDASRVINEFLFSKAMVSTLDTNVIYATAISGANINKTEEVKPLFEKLITMNFDNPVIYETLAQIYEIQKNTEGLKSVVTKGLAKYPKNSNLQVYELNATLDGGDLKESISKFEKAFTNDPTNASLAFNLGVLYDKAQDPVKTKEFYDKAIAMKPDYGDAFFNLGVMFFNAGVAKNKEMNAVDDNKDKDGKIYAGLKAERDELFKKALPNLEKAYEIDPKSVDYKSNLKKVYASMNMLEKAKALGDDTFIANDNSVKTTNNTSYNTSNVSNNTIKIKMNNSKSGVKVVPVKINDLSEIDFIFDTGASETTVTADIVSVLIRQKVITSDDFLPGAEYELADGSTVRSPRFIIKKLQIGSVVFNNIEAGIVSYKTDPLLGQNVLSKFKNVSQNNQEGYIILEK